MAYNTKPIITDKDGNPISQYYNKELDQYEPVEGIAGANKVIVYKSDGNESDISLLPILDKLNQLTGTVIDEEVRKSNELQRIALYEEISRMLQEGELKGDKGDIGNGLEFTWQSTSLGVRVVGDTDYVFVDLQGPQGIQGPPGTIENLDKIHIGEALGYAPVKSINGKTGEEIIITQEDIGLNEEGFVTTGFTTQSIIDIPDEAKEAPIKLNIEGRTVVNLLGKAGDCETLEKVVNSGAYSQLDSDKRLFGNTSIKITTSATPSGYGGFRANQILGKSKYYLVSGYMANTDNASSGAIFRFIPVGKPNLWGNGGWHTGTDFRRDGIKIKPEDYDTATEIRIAVQITDESVIGKFGHMDGVMVNEITKEEYDTLSVEELLNKYPYVSGTQSVEGLLVKSIGKNLCPVGNGDLNGFTGDKTSMTVQGDFYKKSNNTSTNPYIEITNFRAGISHTFSVTGYVPTATSDIRKLVIKCEDNQGNNLTYRQLALNQYSTPTKLSVTLTIPQDTQTIKIYAVAQNGDVLFKDIQLEEGTTTTEYEPYSESSTFISEELYQLPNGVRDTIDGDLLIRRVRKKVLNSSMTYAMLNPSYVGFKRVLVKDVEFKQLLTTGFKDRLIKYDGTSLVYGGTSTLPDRYNSYGADNNYDLAIFIPNSDSGWGDNYTPTPDEIKAYFMGWKMLQQNNTPYQGTGTKYWRKSDPSSPTGDSGTSTTALPTTVNDLPSWQPYQLYYQLKTPEVKQLNLSTLIAKQGGQVQVEGWRKYVINADEVKTSYISETSALAGITIASMEDGVSYVLNADKVVIHGKEQVARGTDPDYDNSFLGKYYVSGRSSGGGDVWFILPKGTTLEQARKQLEGTVIYYKVKPEYHVNPEWSIEVPSTLKTQVNRNSDEVAKVSSLVQEHVDLLKTHGIRLDNVQGIVDSGENINGRYVKFADGTMVCWGTMDLGANLTLDVAPIYQTDSHNAVLFPATFSDVPSVNVTPNNSSLKLFGSKFNTQSDRLSGLRLYGTSTTTGAYTISANWVAIGRWY